MEQTSSVPLMRTVKGVVLGLAVSLGAAVLLTFGFAALLAVGVPDGWIALFAHLTALLAALAGGCAAGMKGKSNGLLTGLFAGVALFLIHFLATILFGELSFSCLTFLAVEALGGVLGGIFGVNLR